MLLIYHIIPITSVVRELGQLIIMSVCINVHTNIFEVIKNKTILFS